MINGLGYVVAVLWGAIPFAFAVMGFVGEPNTWGLIGLLFAIPFALLSWLLWIVVERGFAVKLLTLHVMIAVTLGIQYLSN